MQFVRIRGEHANKTPPMRLFQQNSPFKYVNNIQQMINIKYPYG
jgi:hypothetical protein